MHTKLDMAMLSASRLNQMTDAVRGLMQAGDTAGVCNHSENT